MVSITPSETTKLQKFTSNVKKLTQEKRTLLQKKKQGVPVGVISVVMW